MSTSVPPPSMPEPDRTPASSLGPPSTPASASAPTPTSHGRGSWAVLGGGVAVTVAIVVVAVLVLAGSKNPTLDPVAQAAATSNSAAGYSMRMSMAMTIPSLSGQMTISGVGSINLPDHADSMTMTVHASGGMAGAGALTSLTLPVIVRGTTIYEKFPASLATKLPSGKPWISIDFSKLTGLPGAMFTNPTSTNPGEMLQYLRGSSSDLVVLGHERVGGLATTEYHADIELSRIPSTVPASERAAVHTALSQLARATGLHSLPMDVWIDAHHLVRQVKMTMSPTVSGTTVQETATITIPHYGPEPVPAAPPASQVTDLSSLLSSGLAGAYSGGSTVGG